jgi:hypothetical protein
MARKRRNSELAISFDGLADSTTNLVGTLILLVFLLVGITATKSPDVPGEVPQSWPELPVEDESVSGPRSVDELLQMTQVLQAEMAAVEAEIVDLEEKQLPVLYERAQKVLDNATGRVADSFFEQRLVRKDGYPKARSLDHGISYSR